jgi:hypothetical protein
MKTSFLFNSNPTPYTLQISVKSILAKNARKALFNKWFLKMLYIFTSIKSAAPTAVITGTNTALLGYFLAVQPVLDENDNLRHAAQIAAKKAAESEAINMSQRTRKAQGSATLTIVRTDAAKAAVAAGRAIGGHQ